MATDDFADVVSERISGIRVVKSVGDVARIFSKVAIRNPTNEIDAGQAVVKSVRKQPRHGHGRRTLPIAGVVKDDVIGRIAENKLVQQGGGYSSGQTSDEADPGSLKVGPDGWSGNQSKQELSIGVNRELIQTESSCNRVVRGLPSDCPSRCRTGTVSKRCR